MEPNSRPCCLRPDCALRAAPAGDTMLLARPINHHEMVQAAEIADITIKPMPTPNLFKKAPHRARRFQQPFSVL